MSAQAPAEDLRVQAVAVQQDQCAVGVRVLGDGIDDLLIGDDVTLVQKIGAGMVAVQRERSQQQQEAQDRRAGFRPVLSPPGKQQQKERINE